MITTNHTVNQRIIEEQTARQDNLVKAAQLAQVTLEADHVRPASFIAREPSQRHSCELVTLDSCTCRSFRTFHRCRHHVLLIRQFATKPETIVTGIAPEAA